MHIGYRPTTKEELFNLRHASARNIIERIFGVLKRRFRILLLAPEYNLEIQARIPVALAVLHNFIRIHDPDEGSLSDIPNHSISNNTEETTTGISEGYEGEIDIRRDRIAEEMWIDYQRICQERGIGIDDPTISDEFDDDNDGDEDT